MRSLFIVSVSKEGQATWHEHFERQREAQIPKLEREDGRNPCAYAGFGGTLQDMGQLFGRDHRWLQLVMERVPRRKRTHLMGGCETDSTEDMRRCQCVP